ncbi:MAG: acetyl-CoA carboxylase biotin carboxyl carrier protein subunit [Oscillochloris sp.]|nr:acetyl-CoA carboxylase biotin carboxyl carrier protein subunit [Oscillochloris sp.]
MKRLRITVNGVAYEVEVEVLEDDEHAPALPSGVAPPMLLNDGRPAAAPAPAAAPSTPVGPANARTLTSPIAGIVVEVKVSVGSTVKENDPLLVIEAMKMNTNVSSPFSGRIKSVVIKAGESVRQGQPLLEFE